MSRKGVNPGLCDLGHTRQTLAIMRDMPYSRGIASNGEARTEGLDMVKLTTRGIATAEAIGERVDFTTSGALRAAWHDRTPGPWGTGVLPAEHASALLSAFPGRVYIVWSYATPIAWYDAAVERWTVPQVKYSLTTTKHQGNLYKARNADGSAANMPWSTATR